VVEVGDDLRYLGERRCLRQVTTVTIADVVGKDGIERLREGSSAMLTNGSGTIYLAHQLIDVPMVLRYAFNKLIKSLDEVSNLGSMSVVDGVRVRTTYILATKIET
jgi:hypothetical protein